MKKYPLIISIIKRDKNTEAKCKCGEVAKFKTEIQINYFRGDDEVLWSCDDHKKDLQFLMNTKEMQADIDNATLLRASKLKY